MKKRIFSLVLTAALIFSAVPTMVFAETSAALESGEALAGQAGAGEPMVAAATEHTPGTHGGDWTALTSSSTDSRITAFEADKNYYLSADIDNGLSTITVSSGEVTLCLNGYTLKTSYTTIEVAEGATLNICDCSSGGAGKITSQRYAVDNKGTLNIMGGTFNATTTSYKYSVTSSGTVHISGGTLAATGGGYGGGLRVTAGTATITGGTLTPSKDTGGYALAMTGGTCYVRDGANIQSGGKPGVYMDMEGNSPRLYIEGGTVGGSSTNAVDIRSGSVVITGGTLTGTSNATVTISSGSLSVSGGAIQNTGTGSFPYALQVSSNGTLYLSGSPTISGGTGKADISFSGGSIYAHGQDDSSANPYSGDELKINVGSAASTVGTTIVNNVTSGDGGNRDKFSLTTTQAASYQLVLGGDGNDLILSLPPVGTPTGLSWSGTTATWTGVENANGYSVQLYRDGEKVGNVEDVTETSHTFDKGVFDTAGSYTFTVTAKGDGKNTGDSPAATVNNPLVFYSVTLPTGTGYTATAQSGSPVPEGGSYSFTVTITEGYKKSSSFAVKANSEALEGTGDVYTISSISTNQAITVEGVESTNPGGSDSNSGGNTGSRDEPRDEPAAERITVPVTGEEDTVRVSASVSGSTAAVEEVSREEIEAVMGRTAGAVEVDLSELGKAIDTAELPVGTFEEILAVAESLEAGAASLEIVFPQGAMALDHRALEAIVEQAGSAVRLVLEEVGEARLNAAQQAGIADLNVHGGFEAYLVRVEDNRRISDFRGGTATFSTPFPIPAGLRAEGFNVWYVDDAGGRTRLPTWYADGCLLWSVGHCSDFIIAYDAAAAQLNPPQTGDAPSMAGFAMLALAGLALLLRRRRRA